MVCIPWAYLRGCLFPDIVVCMLTAVAYIVMDSHVEMVKSGRSVHIAMLSVHSIQCTICFSRKYASYAVDLRICAVVMGGKAMSTDFTSVIVLVGSKCTCVMGFLTMFCMPVCM